MLLKRIFNRTPINWKYAVGETLLIFIGISLSLLFEEWRTQKAKDQIEREHISILIKCVENDVVDLRIKLSESNKTLITLQYLISSLERGLPFNDSIARALGYIVYNPQFSADLSGLKNIEGQELIIADIGLRTQIHAYYARVQNNAEWAEGVHDHIDNYFNPRVITDFKDFMFMEKGIPYDFNKLSKDYIFLNALKRSERLNVVSVDRLQSQKQHAEDFLLVLKKKNGVS
jgi:hypothetical protein